MDPNRVQPETNWNGSNQGSFHCWWSGGARSKSGSIAGGGVVFRDQDGAFRGDASHVFDQVCSPEVAELL